MLVVLAENCCNLCNRFRWYTILTEVKSLTKIFVYNWIFSSIVFCLSKMFLLQEPVHTVLKANFKSILKWILPIEAKYLRMDQVKFVEGSFLKNFTWSILEYFASNKLDTKLIAILEETFMDKENILKTSENSEKHLSQEL